jgi:hypothetical protein
LCRLDAEAKNWTVDDVQMFLKAKGMGQFCKAFCDKHITGELLLELTKENLGTGYGVDGVHADVLVANINMLRGGERKSS